MLRETVRLVIKVPAGDQDLGLTADVNYGCYGNNLINYEASLTLPKRAKCFNPSGGDICHV